MSDVQSYGKDAVKVGFVGFGRMGITHYSILNSHPAVKVQAVCDQSATMLKVVEGYLKVATYKDYTKMLDEVELDCVVVSTPADSHAEAVSAALAKGLHVFVEKPFTLSSAQGRVVLAGLEGRNLVNQVGYVNRYNDVFLEVKRLLDGGVIGEVKSFCSEMYGATVLKDSKSSWRAKKQTGGGCLYEFASHAIDLSLYLFGCPERIAGSVLQSIYSSEVEDLVNSAFIYDRGCTGTILVNWSDESCRKPVNVVSVFGTKGKIIADKHAYKVFMKEPDPANGFQKGWNTRYITDFVQNVRFYLRGFEFTRQLDYFVDSILGKRPVILSSFSDGLTTDVVMEKISSDAAKRSGETPFATDGPSIRQDERESSSLWKKIFK